ncbi:MAG: hypothetical protein U0L97_00605 [Candidatus Saccharimonadaceae bacterium]|nr:hypothetical protein [Candidatus Saccharimonadaceae bacterium]
MLLKRSIRKPIFYPDTLKGGVALIIGLLAFAMPIAEMATATNSRANLGMWAAVPDNFTIAPPTYDIKKSHFQQLFCAYFYKVAPT